MDYKGFGDPVNITFSSADATTAAALVLTDGQGATRTLASNERLMIDSLSCFTALTGTNRVEVFHDINADGNVAAGELIAPFGVGNGGIGFPGEGYAAKLGVTPKVKATQAAQVDVSGVGRITIGGGSSTRPSWKEAQVPS